MKIYLIPLILFLLSQNIFSQKIENALINKWESFAKTRSGMGTTITFNSDGSVVHTQSAMQNYLYGYKNDTLITSLINFVTMEPRLDTSIVKISGDTLTQYYFQNGIKKIRTMFRVSGNEGIIGKWYSKNKMGQTYYYDFRDDHTMYFRLPYKITKGSFTINENVVTIVYENSKPMKWKFEIKNDNLFLETESGERHYYHKAF